MERKKQSKKISENQKKHKENYKQIKERKKKSKKIFENQTNHIEQL